MFLNPSLSWRIVLAGSACIYTFQRELLHFSCIPAVKAEQICICFDSEKQTAIYPVHLHYNRKLQQNELAQEFIHSLETS